MIAKVCGLTAEADVRAALAAGADLVGFLDHPASPRHCPDPDLPRLAGARAVLVAVTSQPAKLAAWARRCGAGWVQPYLPDPAGLDLLRAEGLRILLPWPDQPGQAPAAADLYLWETPVQATGLLGGSGVAHAMRHAPPGPYLLAGGLDAQRLPLRYAALADASGCRGFDAASRLERAPGRKDDDRVERFVRAAHALEHP